MPDRVFNFSPGPAVLPLAALEQAQQDLIALPDVGMSVMEISHRSKPFDAIMIETRQLLTDLIGIPAGYTMLFLQGGASLQFSMLPMNFLRSTGQTADYVVTGTWGGKGREEAEKEGAVNVAWDGKSHNYSYLPTASELKLSANAAYTHVTSNETIQGVQFPSDPHFGTAPLICDSSSDFMCRPIDIKKYDVLYACAQKNAGIAGVTVVILKNELLERCAKGLPSTLDYKLIAKNDSLYNTPPVFAIYMLMLVCRWLKHDIGGLQKMLERNQAKSKLLYDVLDASGGFYQGHARKDCRSLMNVTFRLPSEEIETKFIAEAKALKLIDLKGHRSVGGIRASIYNAMPPEGVKLLSEFMADFQKKNG
jgi:phosphoserine aminotransferase